MIRFQSFGGALVLNKKLYVCQKFEGIIEVVVCLLLFIEIWLSFDDYVELPNSLFTVHSEGTMMFGLGLTVFQSSKYLQLKRYQA